ncbi:hypothetical protein Trydic_g244 [Trypoxylus dichotomus]
MDREVKYCKSRFTVLVIDLTTEPHAAAFSFGRTAEQQRDSQVCDFTSPRNDASLEGEIRRVAVLPSSATSYREEHGCAFLGMDGHSLPCVPIPQSVECCLETSIDHSGVGRPGVDADIVRVHRQVDVRGCRDVAGVDVEQQG